MHPVIHIVLPSYGVFAAVGAIIAILFLFFRTDKYGVLFTDFLKMVVLCLIFGAIGSRLVFIASRIPWLILNFSVKNVIATVIGGGFVFYGGLFGVLLGVYCYSKKHNYDLGKMYNMMAPTIPLFHSIGRIGCLMAGCCYGFEFSERITVFNLFYMDRFPTQIIEAVFEIILFVVILVYQKKKENPNALRLYLVSYAVFRFLLEFARGDSVRGVFLILSTSQIISLGILLYFCVKKITCKRQKNVQTST